VSTREGRPVVLTQDRQFFRVSVRDFDDPPVVLTRVPLPRAGSVRSARYRRDVAARLVALDVRPPKQQRPKLSAKAERDAEVLAERARAHPCHACPERAEHERWAARAGKLESQIAAVDRRIRTKTETLARQLDRVLAVLEELGYVEGFSIRPKGEMLARIYGEGDILVAEAIDAGLFGGLSPPEAAAVISAVVFESRERVPTVGEMPTARTVECYEALQGLWREIRHAEDRHSVQLCRELDAGFATQIFHWSEGKPLEDVLHEADMAPGDFVRNCKQLLDLLRQIEEVAPAATAANVRAAREAVDHGVVAYTGV
jgi:ATP-dependent RNA helicase HelY